MQVKFELVETWILEVENDKELARLRKANRDGEMDLRDAILDDGVFVSSKITKGTLIK